MPPLENEEENANTDSKMEEVDWSFIKYSWYLV
jgi:hypothetical protein